MVINKKRLVSTFLDLVKIDSPSGFESLVRSYIQKRLKKMNILSVVDDSGNLFARVPGFGQPLVLCAHMDTVEPGRKIRPIIKDGVISSDGKTILGADNKVAIAAILELLETHNENRHALEIVFSVREETDGGIIEFNFKRLKGKMGLIADRASGIGSIVYTSPWINNLSIKVLGKTAHAGSPEKGINALTVAVSAISKIKLGRVDKKTTVNIGIINGGSAMNSIPGEVELTGEVRSFSRALVEKNTRFIEKVFTEKASDMMAKVDIKKTPYCSGYVYKKTDAAVKRVRYANEKTGAPTSYEISFGASDANTFIEHNIDMVNVGDGSRNPHTTKERVSVDNLIKLTELFSAYVSI